MPLGEATRPRLVPSSAWRPVVVAYPLLLIALLIWVEVPGDTRLAQAVQNAGHAPLFGILALCLHRLLPAGWTADRSFWRSRYTLALAGTLLVGGVTELVQGMNGRSASLSDLVLDGAGAAAFLLLQAAFAGSAGGWRRGVRAGAAVLLLAGAALSPLAWAGATVARNRHFPELVAAGAGLAGLFLEAQNASLSETPPPAGWPVFGPPEALRLDLLPGRYSGLVLTEPVADWTAYDRLEMDFFVPGTSPLRLTMRIDDRVHRGDPRDRYNESFLLRPGFNRLVIPLERIRRAPAGRALDLRAVSAVYLYASRLREPRSLLIGHFRLARGSEAGS